MSKIRSFFLALTATATAVSLAACGGEATDSPDSPATAASGDGGTIDVAFPFAPTSSLSPYSDDGMIISRAGITETLIFLDENGQPAPGLAESWETPDARTLVMQLEEGVTFHDGEELTADGVVTALQSAYDATNRPRALGTDELTFEATGDLEVTVTSNVDDPILPLRFTDPRVAIFSPATYTESDEAPTDTIGTGPYVFTDFAGTELTAEAFDNYRGGDVQADSLIVHFYEDAEARVNAFRAGDVEVADAISTAQMPLLEDGQVESYPIPRGTYLHLNTAEGVFADPAQRAAAMAAIDASVVPEVIYEGYADPADGNPFPPGQDWSTTVDYSPTTDNAAEPSSETITIATYIERAELPEALSVIAEQLREAGFTVETEVGESANMEEDILAGAYDMVVYSRNNSIGAPDPVSFLASDYSCEGDQNVSQYCNEEIDAQIEEALDIVDLEERYQRAAEIGAAIVADNAVLPLVHERARVGVDGATGLYFDPYERRFVQAETTLTS